MKKFLDYARWDLTIYRSIYTRSLWMLALGSAVPTIIYLISLVYVFFWGNIEEPMLTHKFYNSNIEAADSTLFIIGLAQLCCIGQLCYTLKDKASRLSEFMLPASQKMKFLWRVLLVTVGVFLLGQVLVVLLGLIRYVFTAMFLGFGSTSPIFYDLHGVSFSHFMDQMAAASSELSYETGGLVPSVYIAFGMGTIWMAAFLSVYPLASAYKFSRGVLYGTLVHFVVFFAMVFLLSRFSTIFEPYFVRYACPRDLGWFMYGFTFVHLIILVCCWWGAWRLYRSAQLTTRRNP